MKTSGKMTGAEPACSFTGHRDISPAHVRLIDAMLDRAIDYAYRQGCRVFCTGGAVGFDTIAAQRVLYFRMSHSDVYLSLMLPCLDQTRMWSSEQKKSYNYILSRADSVEYSSDAYTSDCMRRRNLRLAERCEIMIAYVGHSHSGAAQTMRMAKERGKQVYNIYPALDKEAGVNTDMLLFSSVQTALPPYSAASYPLSHPEGAPLRDDDPLTPDLVCPCPFAD